MSSSSNVPDKQSAYPLITVCMLVKNRKWCIERVLSSLVDVEYPKNAMEIVLIDNMSTDGTYEALTDFVRKVSSQYYRIALFREEGNIPHLRNLCLNNANGRYILYWDSDILPPRNLIKVMVSLAEGDKKIGIIEPNYIAVEITELARYMKYIDKPISTILSPKHVHATGMGFALVRTDVARSVGGFNEALSVGEDTVFSISVFDKGYRNVRLNVHVLHLTCEVKRSEKWIVRPSNLLMWLRYNFSVRAEEYCSSFNSLPRFLKARIFYYLGLPWVIVLSITSAVSKPILAIILPLYLALSIYLVVKERGLKDGIMTWLKFNVPTGLALSYGVLRVAIKKLARAGASRRHRV